MYLWELRGMQPADMFCGVAEEGKVVCLVTSDVEGSTELWEWDREAMDSATKVHDRIMRSKLGTFHGYEVSTEGDSFLMAFHDPTDAIAWAITTQQASHCSKGAGMQDMSLHSCQYLRQANWQFHKGLFLQACSPPK